MKYPTDLPVKVVQLGAGGAVRLRIRHGGGVCTVLCGRFGHADGVDYAQGLGIGALQLQKTPEMVILLGAVDNNKSRQLCHRAFCQSKDLIYIDSGNGEFSGQVVCGVRKNGRTVFKPIGGVMPELLRDTDKFPTELSCAEAAQADPQSMAANITAATAVVNMVYNILAVGDSTVRKVTSSNRGVNVRPEIQKRRKAA